MGFIFRNSFKEVIPMVFPKLGTHQGGHKVCYYQQKGGEFTNSPLPVSITDSAVSLPTLLSPSFLGLLEPS